MKLWYDKAASQWEEALPLGNGRVGAMIWGGTDKEIIGINEDTLWSGYYRDKNNPNALKYLQEARNKIFNGEQGSAHELISSKMLGNWSESYLQFGNIEIEFNDTDIENYSRELDLENAICRVIYSSSKVNIEREMFISYPDNVFVMKFKADKKAMNFKLSFTSQIRHETFIENNALVIKGKCPSHVEPNYVSCKNPIEYEDGGLEFIGVLSPIIVNGEINYINNSIEIKNVDLCVFYFNCSTNYKHINVSLPQKDYYELRENHINDYQSLYKRVDINLGEKNDLPTDLRIKNIKNGIIDNDLYALYYQYSRYLLIASSREGSQAANLQGIWSWEIRPPWSSNWTTNINAEMNYWHAHSCNLNECLQPYFELIKDLSVEGEKTAKINYGCRGFCVNHNVDLWRMTSPADNDARHSYWPMAGGFMVRELYEHFLYTNDYVFLKEEAFLPIKKAALFFNDWLIMHNGYYVTCPSTSPENVFYDKHGKLSSANFASAMDMTIIREVFMYFLSCCELLQLDDPLKEEIQHKLSKLAPYTKGKKGELLEFYEDFVMIEKGHRHLSHLYGIYPSNILFENNEYYEMAKNAFLDRLEYGSGHTGWSCAWIINLWARFRDGEEAYKFLNQIISNSTYPNLFDAHPPFQIDGNFGATAGICEMLLQSHREYIEILPAKPNSWDKGYVKGLKARGNATVDIQWDPNEIVCKINALERVKVLLKGTFYDVFGEVTLTAALK